MYEKMITVQGFIGILKRYYKIVISLTLGMTILFGAVNYFFIKPKYEATTKLFLGKGYSEAITYDINDIYMYKDLTKTYDEIIRTEDLIQNAISNTKYNMTVKEVLDNLVVIPIPDTQIIKINYTNTDPQIANNILKAILNEFIDISTELVPNGSINILNDVRTPEESVNTSMILIVIMGAILGLVMSFVVLLLLEYFDNTINKKEEIEKILNLPVLATLPECKI